MTWIDVDSARKKLFYLLFPNTLCSNTQTIIMVYVLEQMACVNHVTWAEKSRVNLKVCRHWREKLTIELSKWHQLGVQENCTSRTLVFVTAPPRQFYAIRGLVYKMLLPLIYDNFSNVRKLFLITDNTNTEMNSAIK